MKTVEPSSVYFAAGITALVLAAALLVALTAETIFKIMPCEMCLMQRWPYYLGASFALILSTMAHYRRVGITQLKIGLVALIGILCWSLYLGVWHSGVEWGWWPAPAQCRAQDLIAISVGDLFNQMRAARVIPCDAPAWKLLGFLSFANMNALLSLMLLVLNGLVLAGVNPRKIYGSRTVSQ